MQAIDPSKLQQSIPPALLAYSPNLKSAQFVDLGGGQLGIEAGLHIEVPEDKAQGILNQFAAKA